MEKVYLKKGDGTWYSKNVNLDSYFEKYSEEYCKVIPKQNVSFYNTFKALIGDDSNLDKKEITKSLHELRELRKKFKTPLPDIETLEKKAKELTLRENKGNSKKRDLEDVQDFTSLEPCKVSLESRELVDNVLQFLNQDDEQEKEYSSDSEHKDFNQEINDSNNIVEPKNNSSEKLPRRKNLETNHVNFEFQESQDNVCHDISNQDNMQEQEIDLTEKCVKERINEIYNSNTKNPAFSKTSVNLLKLKKMNKNKSAKFRKNIFTSRGSLFQGKKVTKNGKKDLQVGKTFLVSFRVHEPFFQRGKGRVGNFQQEIIMLADQTLIELRDKIICSSDFQDVRGDISHEPNSVVTVMSRDKYKSAMFYFNNTFYIDERGDRDYSEVIREWALPRGIEVGPTCNMGSMMVRSLEIRFGYPYVFMHQGSCEHLIIISDARLITGRDSLDSTDYPLLSRIPRTQTRYCFTCLKRPVKWLVFGCENLPLDIAFLCSKCFKSYNYVNGEKVGNFKAYRYFQKSFLL